MSDDISAFAMYAKMKPKREESVGPFNGNARRKRNKQRQQQLQRYTWHRTDSTKPKANANGKNTHAAAKNTLKMDSKNMGLNDSETQSETECDCSEEHGTLDSSNLFSDEYTLSSSNNNSDESYTSGSSGTSAADTALPDADASVATGPSCRYVGKRSGPAFNAPPVVNKMRKVQAPKAEVKEETEGAVAPAAANGSKNKKAPSCPLLRLTGKSDAINKRAQVGTRPSSFLPAASSSSSNKMAINAWKPSARDLPNENEIKTETQLPEVEKVHLQNSVEEGRKAFQWLINPIKPDVFLKENWESNACQVRRKSPDYYSHLISFAMIDEMLLTNHVEFTTNIDITSYVNGERSTLNPEGRAMPPTIWDHYADGCSIRIINPSTFLPSVQVLCTVMQEYFHCLVGANVYLTPPNSQGFAPHYDDIEAFVLQVEGRKRWRLYSPLHKSDALARVSSGNYKQQELGKPIFDVVLEAGDLLYFPRGTVHQAVTEQDYHSLHITLSVYQKQAYADLLEHVLPKTLERSIKHHSVLRRGLPLNIWGNLGMIHKLNPSTERAELLSEVKTLIMNHIMPTDEQIDAAVDQMALRFQREALPPIVDPEEKVRTIFGSRSQTDASGRCLCDYEFTGRTEVRLLRANIVRVVNEGKKKRVYYYVDNGLEYCKYEPNFIEISSSEVCVIQTLIDAYPSYTRIDTLPMESIERCIESATALWERGLLMTKKPFKAD